ncbi:hypothetical protein ACFL24_01320 [Patescibacteria group bacterium]
MKKKLTMESHHFRFGVLFAVLILTFVFIYPHFTHAAALTDLSDTMSRLEKSIASDHSIQFTTPTGAGDSGDTITVTMPAGFTIGAVDFTDIDLSHGATGTETDETLAAAADATSWGAVFAGQVLTLTHPTNAANGDIAATDVVIVEIGLNATTGVAGDQQITNQAASNSYTITIGGTFGDTGQIGIVIIDDDQFTVTGTTDPTITFSLSANTTDFGTLSASSVVTSAPNIVLTVSTNGTNGYTVNIRDAGDASDPGLYSAANLFLVGSADYSYNDSEDLDTGNGYGIQGSSGDATIAVPYNSGGNIVGGYELTDQALATHNATASSHTITITSKAKITGATPAGSYSDTVTVIATGNF